MSRKRRSGGLARKKLGPQDLSSNTMCAGPGTNLLNLDGMFSTVASQNYSSVQKRMVKSFQFIELHTVALHSRGRRFFGPFQTFLL